MMHAIVAGAVRHRRGATSSRGALRPRGAPRSSLLQTPSINFLVMKCSRFGHVKNSEGGGVFKSVGLDLPSDWPTTSSAETLPAKD